MTTVAPFPVLRITATVRPKRVAFLVDPTHVTLRDLDDLGLQAAEHWGGSYWPIVPTDGHEIGASWWTLLDAVDPDVIYSACPLQPALAKLMQRRIGPTAILDLGTSGSAKRDGVLDLRIRGADAAGVSEVVPYHVARSISPERVMLLELEESIQQGPDRDFVLRNFGRSDPTIHAKRAVAGLAKDSFDLGTVEAIRLLDRTRQHPGEWVFPRELGGMHAARPFEPEHDRFHRGFQLIIGDSADESMLFWNRALTSSGHLGRDVLWLDFDRALNLRFLSGVALWIRRFFWNNQNQDGGSVVSYTLPIDVLEDLAVAMSYMVGMYFHPIALPKGTFPLKPPSHFGLRHPSPLLGEGQASQTQNVAFREDGGQLDLPRPSIFKVDHPQIGWMVDLAIENHDRRAGRGDEWHLPRRTLLGSLFVRGSRLGRIVRTGLPSVAVASSDRSLTVNVPSPHEVLRRLLEPPPVHAASGPRMPHPVEPFSGTRTSEPGVRLMNLVGLFGDVGSAGRFFSDPFWRDTFLRGSGRPDDALRATIDVVRREMRTLVEGVKRGEGNEVANGIDAAAERAARAIHRAPSSAITFTLQELKSRFGQLMKDEVVHTGRGLRKPVFNDGADSELDHLTHIGALLPGVTLTCPSCRTADWWMVDDLARSLQCRHCAAAFGFPTEPKWEYRVSGLVQRAITDGLLPVLHVVDELVSYSRRMALIFPAPELRRSLDGRRLTDLDIAAVVDGQFVIGEVKSSPSGFDAGQLAVLREVALEVLPDSVVLAARGTEWPMNTTALIAAFREALNAEGVDVRLVLLDW